MGEFIKTEIKNNIGVIRLDRDEKLNCLSYDMLYEIKDNLLYLEEREDIKLIILKGGERAFCVGGDLLEIYSRMKNEDNPEEFFRFEFEVDEILANLKTPVISFWQGMVMGGGVGLSIGSDIKIADESTIWAMPETRLGMIPDVGVGYYFSKIERPLALYLSLLGESVNAGDLMYLNLADFTVGRKDIKNITDEIISTDFSDFEYEDVLEKAKNIIDKYKIKTDTSLDFENIRGHFDKNSVMEIAYSLKKDGSKWAEDTAKKLLSKCPFSLVTVFHKYEYGKKWSRKETFKKDLDIISYAIKKKNPQEGIRNIMIDKNYIPKFNPEKIEEVDEKEVIGFLK